MSIIALHRTNTPLKFKKAPRGKIDTDCPFSWQLKPALRIATRTSNLALRQVEEVFSQFPEITYNIIPIQSYGDIHKGIPLINNNIEDLFTCELDKALLHNQADLAVHSAKDLPYPLPEGLEIIALLEAHDKTDAIVSRGDKKLSELATNPRIGTSSLLRKSELLKIRPDIQIVSIRGTIEERIQQVDNGYIDAVIVASCALKRLDLESRIAEVLPYQPHPLQGHLAIVAASGKPQLKHIISQKDIRRNFGKVWLVGFGPGDPNLLTIKGQKILKTADIIFYDDLVNKEFLTKLKARKVYVGKRKGNHHVEQAEINRQLYKAAISGNTVVRLKGGDPMLFAHGGEEIEYLKRHLVEVEVVPGITASLAAAAFTHIPLTHRGIASSVTFITGHSANNIHVPSTGTLVYYMGASNICNIAKEVIKKGWQPDTPVLLVYNVTGNDQQHFYTTLQKVLNEPDDCKTPLIIIIGDVVKLKNHPSENIVKPVFLITGTNPGVFAQLGDVIHLPLIEIKPLSDNSHLLTTLNGIRDFHWLIFTSRYAVQYFFIALLQQRKDTRFLSGLKIASIGTTTSSELHKYGIIPDLQPGDESSEGLLKLFRQNNIRDQHILIPRSDIGLPKLPKGLANIGNKVVTISVYANVLPQNKKHLAPLDVDYVVFSSPSCVENFFNIYGEAFNERKFIVQGDETFKKLRNYRIPVAQITRKEEYETIS